LNLLPVGIAQWFNSSVTNDVSLGEFVTDTIANWENNPKVPFWKRYEYFPELSVYCKNNTYKCTASLAGLTLEKLIQDMSFDGLFSSLYLQTDVFIPYFNKHGPQTDYSNSNIINYFRYLFTDDLLGGLFVNRSIDNLMWGYKDRFMEKMRTQNYYLGGDPALDSNFNLLQNMSQIPDSDNFFQMRAGSNDSSKVRDYLSVFGYSNNNIVFREKYFDGKNVVTSFRNPWKEWVALNGTDAMTFHPGFNKDDKPKAFLDDLLRNAKFHYNDTVVHNGLTTYRYLLDEDMILSKNTVPENGVYYADKYNGYANMSSIIKAPFFAHKPYYFQCNDTPASMIPDIKMSASWSQNYSKTEGPEDAKLFNESYFDIEPFSGGTVTAAQKLMISALIERDELFEIDSKFVPIYFVFRTGNLTDTSINMIFGDLVTGLGVKSMINLFCVTLLTLFIALAAHAYIGSSFSNKVDGDSEKSASLV